MILDRFRLDGKTALVTGASAGLGAAIALALAEAGASVACHGNSRPASDTAGRIVNAGGRATAVQCDLAREGGAHELFLAAERAIGTIDVLVNNAGVIKRAPASEYSDADWELVLRVNLTSVFRLSQLVGRRLLELKRPGKIVNIASLLSFQGGVFVPAYSASKAGVAQITMALANEWASRGINVNAIAPGYMKTTNTTALREDPVRSRQIMERIPAQRWGEPEDVAGAAVFLASAASDYVHGHVLVVDGGWMGR
ncbi:MAG TPA: SDR family oxidoreductase [Terriglobales bacterium]|nr:SDR family oxidoreductase [Terriglobales bacterium]